MVRRAGPSLSSADHGMMVCHAQQLEIEAVTVEAEADAPNGAPRSYVALERTPAALS